MASAPAVVPFSTPALDKQEQEEVDRLETIVERIRNKTPPQPYIVSVTSEFSYHPLKVRYDFRESRFDRSERQLEYSSFLYRDTTSNRSLLHLEAQDMDQLTPMESTPRPDKMPSTNPSTPALGPKKKISLADYKKAKVKGQKSVNAADGKVEQDKVPVSVAANNGSAQAASKLTPSSQDKSTPAKSHGNVPHSNSEGNDSGHRKTASGSQTPAGAAPQVVPRPEPAKRATPPLERSKASELQTHEPRKPSQKTEESHHVDHALPVSPSSLRSSATIGKRSSEVPKIRIDDSDSPLPDHLSPITTPECTPSPTSLRLSASTSKSAHNSVDISIDLPTDSAFEKAKQVAKATSTEQKPRPAGSSQDQIKASTGKRPRAAIDAEDSGAEKKGVKRLAPDSVRSEKRSREVGDEDEDSSNAKRARTSDVGMRTSQRAEGQARTSKTNVTTPTKPAKQGGDAAASAVTPEGHLATPSSKTNDSVGSKPNQKWRRELSRLEEVGKRLKRQAQPSPAAKDKTARKLRLAQSIESVICFMTAFCANDQIRETHESWRSLSGFLDEVTMRAEGWQHMQGLCLLLRASCCQRSVSILSNFKMSQFKDKSKMEEHLTAAQTYVQRADKFARDSNKLLSRATLAEHYPAAYRASDAIPLATPAAMPVIRMAMKLLGEWCKHEKVDWTPQYEEGECSKL